MGDNFHYADRRNDMKRTIKPLNHKESSKPAKAEIEELRKIYRKYHPQENDKSLKVDDEYKKRLENVLGITIE